MNLDSTTNSHKKRRPKGARQSELYADSIRPAIRRRSSRGNPSSSLLAHTRSK
jgi:hypothetical protein